MMNLGLEQKAALVMASSSGLGLAVAQALAAEGAGVMLFSTNEEKLAAAAEQIHSATGARPSYFVGDCTRAEDIEGAVRATQQRYGPIYALVNNSGGPPAGPFDAFDDAAWQDAFALTLLSYVRAIRCVLPQMRANGGGRILNSTSSSVKVALDNLLLSNTFRMGVVGLSKTLSQELGLDSILVNVLAPGRIATQRVTHLDEIRAQRAGTTPEEIRRRAEQTIPLGRYGDPTEYGALAAFLCSPRNTFVTGQTILVDGGMVKAY